MSFGQSHVYACYARQPVTNAASRYLRLD